MTTTTAGPDVQEQVVFLQVSWETYEAIAAGVGEDNHTLLAYDGETLELMSPLNDHETYTALVDLLLSAVMSEWDINLYCTRSSTLKTKPVGAEPDTSYYIENAGRIDGMNAIDLRTSPAPDLVVEVHMSHRRMDKLDLYAKLDVPECWRYGREGLRAFSLVDGVYVEVAVSAVIPGLPLSVLATFLGRRTESNRRALLKDWQEWLRTHRRSE